jgi:hypothetical protein
VFKDGIPVTDNPPEQVLAACLTLINQAVHQI